MEVFFLLFYVGVSICVVGVLVWLLLFVNQDVYYSNQFWWQFVLDVDVLCVLCVVFGSCLLFLVLVFGWLLCVVLLVICELNVEELQCVVWIICYLDQLDGGLVLIGDKVLFFYEGDDVFFMYVCCGCSMIVLYDLIGLVMQCVELIWQFCDFCDLYYVCLVFYQVCVENLLFYMDIGLIVFKFGEEV